MRAGARADHQEKRVLNFAVQPDDASEAAKHFALAAFAQHRGIAAAERGSRGWTGGQSVHRDDPKDTPAAGGTGRSRRAARSFRTNWVAFTT